MTNIQQINIDTDESNKPSSTGTRLDCGRIKAMKTIHTAKSTANMVREGKQALAATSAGIFKYAQYVKNSRPKHASMYPSVSPKKAPHAARSVIASSSFSSSRRTKYCTMPYEKISDDARIKSSVVKSMYLFSCHI